MSNKSKSLLFAAMLLMASVLGACGNGSGDVVTTTKAVIEAVDEKAGKEQTCTLAVFPGGKCDN